MPPPMCAHAMCGVNNAWGDSRDAVGGVDATDDGGDGVDATAGGAVMGVPSATTVAAVWGVRGGGEVRSKSTSITRSSTTLPSLYFWLRSYAQVYYGHMGAAVWGSITAEGGGGTGAGAVCGWVVGGQGGGWQGRGR